MTKVLVVDDDVALSELLTEVLTLEGFDVINTYNGKEALEKLDNQIDIILLDISMPVLNGLETLKIIRQKYTTPVIMLTARGDDLDRVLGLELGADDYLAKPFNDRELIARIKAILRRTNTKSTNQSIFTEVKPIQFEGLELNPSLQTVYYNEIELVLTGTEFALLQMLINHIGTIVSREVLSLEVLGKRLSTFDRSIDMHMSNLRRKLPERADGSTWFKTVRGRGYILVQKNEKE
ncbi:MAG: response regulator [Pasteurellaceae bacterium]|nr:response regulator [Pasteurellaceae bacterium]